MDEKKLVQGCAAGEEDSWNLFFSTYSDCIFTAVKKTLHRYSRDTRPETVEDLFGEVMLLLVEDGCGRLKSFEGRNGCSLSTFLFVIASRVTIDHLRRQRNVPMFADGEHALLNAGDTRELPDKGLEISQQAEMVRDVLAGLPPQDRLFVKLHYEDGLSTEEIAVVLRVSPATVYSKKNRVREKMQKIFRKKFTRDAVIPL